MAEWTSNANDVLKLSLVRAPEDKVALGEEEQYEGFHPTFTYPIYGEEEKIYGYQDLSIDLKFASGSLVQWLDIKHSGKLSSSTVDDARGKLLEFLPSDLCKDEAEFDARVLSDAESFTPPGTKVHSYTRRSPSATGKGKGIAPPQPDDEDAVEYEVYHTMWDTPGFREYHRRMQLFVLLYIEGGSYIVEDEDNWEFVVLYEKRKRRGDPSKATYHFIGYSSLYPFYCFPDKIRLRLSQFVILPPYQRQGHGLALYGAIYAYVLATPRIAELTVEDPAEAFEDLRDVADLRMLLAHPAFISEALGAPAAAGGVGPVRTKAGRSGKGAAGKGAARKGKLGPPVERGWTEKWRVGLKLAGRQYQRLIEMLILLHFDPTNKSAAKAYRLQVKERLYRFNYETLMQLEKEERHQKLEETFQNVREDYLRILKSVR